MRLILLPGLGADDRQFEPQRNAFANLLVPPWIPPRKSEGLAEYAERFAETLAATGPTILGGSSFGGMVAWEMARCFRPDAVVLIGSCRSPQGIRPLLRCFRPIVPLVPARLLDAAKLFSPLAVAACGSIGRQEGRLCVAMFRDAGCRFVKWAISALLGWQPSSPRGIPVFQIHGQNDMVIPIDRVEADEVVIGGGHLINLTHAGQVNAFIARTLNVVG